MSERRKSVKDRLKQFEPDGTEATAPSLTSPPSLGMGTSGQAEGQTNEQSSARQQRKDERNKSIPTTNTRDKSAAHTGPQYSSTNNPGFMNSFGISDLPNSPVSLTSPVTSPTYTSPNPYPSLQLEERSSNRFSDRSSVNRGSSSQSQSAGGGNTSENIGGGGRTPVPPLESQRPSDPFVRTRRNKRTAQGDEGNSKGKPHEPLKGKHDKPMLRADSSELSPPSQPPHTSQPTLESHRPHNPQYLSTQYSTDSLPSSPPCSDEYPPTQTDAGSNLTGSPCQADNCSANSKFVGGAGHPSMRYDPETGKPSLPCDPETGKPAKHENLLKQISSASTDSSGSDKLCLEDSIPMGVYTGEKKIRTPFFRNLRDENDKLREEIERQKEEIRAVGRRESQQEHGLMRQVVSLKYQLTVREQEVKALTEHNARKKKTIDCLTKTVETKDFAKRRGYHSKDVDECLGQITQLTSQLSALEEKDSEHVKKIANLEGKLFRMTDVARLTKRFRDDNTRLETQVKELTSSLESAQLSIDEASAPMLEESADTRLLTLEAHKVPDLENEVEELKKKLKDIEQDTARQYQDRQMSQVMEISQKEDNLRKLSSEMELLREEYASLSSRFQSPTTSDPTLGTDSYQILFQDSTDKDQNIRQLKRLVEDKQMLLEVKAQELQAKSQNMEAENAKQMEEINKLKDLNTKLLDRVVTPIGSQAAGASADTTETEVLQQGGAQLKKDAELNLAGSTIARQKARIKEQIRDLEPGQKRKSTDSDRKFVKATVKIQTLEETIKELEEQIKRGQPMSSGNGGDGNKSAEGRSVIDEQQQKIRDLEQQIHDMEVGQESMYKAMDDNQAALDKMSKYHSGLLEHSKSQSKSILMLKDKLKSLQQELNDLKREVPGLKDAITKQHTELQQVARQRDELMGDVEAYKQTISQKEENLRKLSSEMELLREENASQSDNNTRLQTQVKELTSSLDSSQQSIHDAMVETRASTRLLTLEACKVPDLQKEVEELKKKLEDIEQDTARQHQDRQKSQEARDELAPYVLPQLPYLGECQGAGSYGSVYRIHLNGINCIAKRIHDILLGQGREKGVNIEDKQAAYQKFYSECVLLSRMRHPNIVQFMGVYYGPQRDYGKELTLVMERLYLNLEDCLEQYKNIEMWVRVSILLDISQGLLHLHSRGVVHRDLTAANILLTTSFHAKIADLGVSKIINVHPLAASKQSMIPGTLGYMPPEALAEIPEYGSALDVFSFGVLILFVVLQEYPQFYDNLVTPEGLIRKESHIQKRSKWINKISSDNPFRQLICDCLQDVPARRPTTNNLNSSLIQIAEMYPKPYQDIIDILSH